jgi:hypothetical protein
LGPATSDSAPAKINTTEEAAAFIFILGPQVRSC